MYIDNVISSFDFDKFKSDCFLHGFLKTYILGQYLENALCFPSGCKDCVGMQKCANCLKQDDLGEAFVELHKYL